MVRQRASFLSRASGCGGLGFVGTFVPLLGHVAACPCERHERRHLLDGFLLQHTQNRDTVAIQAKLDEIIRTSKAQNRYIGIEELTDDELEELRARSRAKAQQADERPPGAGRSVG
jgi:hypothetical protein